MRVLPTHQRQGYGAKILAALEARAQELGYRRVALDTADEMLAARRFYEKHGYRVSGSREWQGMVLRLYEKGL